MIPRYVYKKNEIMQKMLRTLCVAVDHYERHSKLHQSDEDLRIVLRDSLIKRFEYCVDHFWKYVSVYIREVSHVKPVTEAPADIFRTACKIGVITDLEAERGLEMVKVRNQTTHLYKEELAQVVAGDIAGFYDFMEAVMLKLKLEK